MTLHRRHRLSSVALQPEVMERKGTVGLLVVGVLLVAQSFGILGVAPTVDRWDSPETTWIRVVVFGLACLVVTRGVRMFDDEGVVPEPAGLLVTLIGLLAIMNGLYVWAITTGPLVDEEE